MISSSEKSPEPIPEPGESAQTIFGHLSISILVPSCFCLALSVAVAEAFPRFVPLSAFSLLAPCLIAIVSAVSSLVLERERSSRPAFIRSFILSLIALWPLQALLLPRPGGISFLPDIRGLSLIAVSALSFLFAAKFRGFFRARELFLGELKGLEGVQLQNAVREEAYLAELSREEMESSMSFASIFIFFLGAGLLVLFGVKGRISVLLTLSFALSISAAVFLKAIVSDFVQAQTLFGLGIIPRNEERASKIRLILVAVICLSLVSFLVASDGTILPFKWILDFLNFLFSFLRFDPNAMPRKTNQNSLAPDIFRQLAEQSEAAGKGGIDLSLFFEILKKLGIAAAAIGFVLFLVSPLFSRRFLPFLAARKPLKAFSSALRFVKWILSLLFGKRRPLPGLSLTERRRIERDFESMVRRKKDSAKAKETGKMAKAFVKLIARGTELGNPYLPSSVPLEWAKRLAAKWPHSPENGGQSSPAGFDAGTELPLAAEIFEEALYSERLVAEKRAKRYFEIIESAVVFLIP